MAVITKNVSVVLQDDQEMYQYDEARFYVPDDREILEEDIDEWFEYASEEHNPPTVEERIETLEDIVEYLISM